MSNFIDDPLGRLVDDLQHVNDKYQMFMMLHGTVQRFKHDRRYLNDTRYIRVWLQYASFFNDPGWVYKLMLESRIGEYVGAVYEWAAEYYGHRNMWEDAEALVKLGIQKRAEPLSRLQVALQYVRGKQLSGTDEIARGHERRIATVTRCYSGHEELSFEELRAQLLHHQTSFGSRSEEARLNNTPSSPSTDHGRPHVAIPHDPVFLHHALAHLDPPLDTYTGFHDVSALQISTRLRPGQHLSDTIKVARNIRRGGMANIYLVAAADRNFALKVETPPNPWEFYILRQLSHRLRAPNLAIESHALYLYKNASLLVLEYADQGTLLDCFNNYRSRCKRLCMDEYLVIFLIMRLLEAVEGTHSAGIIHGDIKLDNIMLAMESCHLPLKFDSDNEQWKKQYLVLIDFGRSVDLTLLPSQTYLKANWSPAPADLPAIRQDRAFLPCAIDYYGVADIAHLLLFGKPMELKVVENIYKIQNRFRRYWQCDLWGSLFDTLLNPGYPDAIAKAIHVCNTTLQNQNDMATCISHLAQ